MDIFEPQSNQLPKLSLSNPQDHKEKDNLGGQRRIQDSKSPGLQEQLSMARAMDKKLSLGERFMTPRCANCGIFKYLCECHGPTMPSKMETKYAVKNGDRYFDKRILPFRRANPETYGTNDRPYGPTMASKMETKYAAKMGDKLFDKCGPPPLPWPEPQIFGRRGKLS